LYPLVVEPIVEGALLPQTLIDGASGLNASFIDTLTEMDFDFMRLTECDEPFFSIVPGKAAYPMGRVSLPVTFGPEENFRMEYLSFEVTNFKPSYHATVYNDLLVSFKCALLEFQSLPRVWLCAESQIKNSRQRWLCREFFIWLSAQKKHLANGLLCREPNKKLST
jgi:hypothetical protein